METIVVKFGGSSLADAQHFRAVADIVKADPRRHFVVASAPGKRGDGDTKVTDLLYRCYDAAVAGGDWQGVLAQIKGRYSDIVTELGIDFALDREIEIIAGHLAGQPSRDYMASRGEYLNSRILAAYLGFPFFDAAKLVRFSPEGVFDEEATNTLIGAALDGADCGVVPGFYGATAGGTVYTFSRGGSDVTGALVARGVGAAVYENWTDVSGMLFTDPHIVPDPRPIEYITYRELRELAYMGASVLHEDAVFPVRKANIPINIRNTNRPGDAGTWIVGEVPSGQRVPTVTGVAGKRGFCSINIEKSSMNGEIGFGKRLLEIFAECGLSFEHCPSGIDTMSVIVAAEPFREKKDAVMEKILTRLHPEYLSVEYGMALIAVVGHGMVAARGVAARIFRTVADAGINIRMIDQGSSELNIILGVDDDDLEEAIRSIYREFR